mmetsp:Transcript_32378/g.62238  ORF Transcript_32378/g.62238 Transcript_32378/m.62238 type:complete len:244 (-) Transcript_32378:430-1161(-)|eukprot:CAMPEP_0114319470 /NCGR_PEP_ID=MMETSP0059-20121206/25257_1 /TAXON_ID=36894 /ORGANISM="Pyramimonas parkeae, Strain CCMP726" /LENGTH=243 /DNA_ID=CAMNT_0001446477 /DNA_START=121 /DNA_END=852 /DNA_ORIENTATION=-
MASATKKFDEPLMPTGEGVLYGFFCAPCAHAHVKANLNGRDCSGFDCLCGSMGSMLAVRRHIRQKYNLDLEMSQSIGGCFNCQSDGQYCQDVWTPCCLMCVPIVDILTICAYGCANTRMVNKLNQDKVLGWGAHAEKPKSDRPYSHGMCGCFSSCSTCIYATCCPCCAAAQATAMVQGRTCDTCDLCGAYNTYELRQSVRAKYGIHGNPSDDAINVCCCSACVFCQDYAELVARDGGSSYMAN